MLLYIIHWGKKRMFILIFALRKRNQNLLQTKQSNKRLVKTFPVSEAQDTNSKQSKGHGALALTGHPN